MTKSACPLNRDVASAVLAVLRSDAARELLDSAVKPVQRQLEDAGFLVLKVLPFEPGDMSHRRFFVEDTRSGGELQVLLAFYISPLKSRIGETRLWLTVYPQTLSYKEGAPVALALGQLFAESRPLPGNLGGADLTVALNQRVAAARAFQATAKFESNICSFIAKLLDAMSP